MGGLEKIGLKDN